MTAECVRIGECGVFISNDASLVKVYAISLDGQTPVYIGRTMQTVSRRIHRHFTDALRDSDLPIHSWLRLQLGIVVTVLEEIHSSLGEDYCVEREQFWIRKHKGALLNLTDGGKGMSGHKLRPAHSRKIGDTLRKGQFFLCECGQRFWRKPRDVRLGKCRFCSRVCYQRWQKGRPKRVPAESTRRMIDAAAVARRKRTHCRQGHEFCPENTRISAIGSRVCRACTRRHKAAYLSRKRVHA